MRNFLLLALLFAFAISVKPAGALEMRKGPMTLGTNQQKPDLTALLDMVSTAKGLLIPRMTEVERDAIVTPALGLQVYNLTTKKLNIWNSIVWVEVGASATQFQVTQITHGRAIGYPLTPVYWDAVGGVWTDAKADANATLASHMIVQVFDVDNFLVSKVGRYTIPGGHSLLLGEYYYTSLTVAGAINNTLTTGQVYVNPMLFTEDADTIHIVGWRANESTTPVTSPVNSVFGRAGDVTATYGDYFASLVGVVPTTTMVEVDVQLALEGLDTRKQDTAPILDAALALSGTGPGLLGFRSDAFEFATIVGTNGVTVSNGDLATATPITITVDVTNIDHNTLLNYVPDEHIDWTSATQTFNTSGGVISTDLTLTGGISVTGLVDGRDVSVDGTKLDTIAVGADVTTISNVAASGAIMDTDFGSNGYMIRTGAGTYAPRSLTTGSGRITIVNPDGVAADSILDVDESQINIANLGGYVADSFIDHSTLSIRVDVVGDGLQGGGVLTGDVFLALDIQGQPDIVASANDDLFMVWDFSTNENRKMSLSDLKAVIAGAGARTYNEAPAVSAGSPNVSIIVVPINGTERVYLNGIRQLKGAGNDYTIAGNNITFTFNLVALDVVIVDYNL